MGVEVDERALLPAAAGQPGACGGELFESTHHVAVPRRGV
jgi:hypothetical protein